MAGRIFIAMLIAILATSMFAICPWQTWFLFGSYGVLRCVLGLVHWATEGDE